MSSLIIFAIMGILHQLESTTLKCNFKIQQLTFVPYEKAQKVKKNRMDRSQLTDKLESLSRAIENNHSVNKDGFHVDTHRTLEEQKQDVDSFKEIQDAKQDKQLSEPGQMQNKEDESSLKEEATKPKYKHGHALRKEPSLHQIEVNCAITGNNFSIDAIVIQYCNVKALSFSMNVISGNKMSTAYTIDLQSFDEPREYIDFSDSERQLNFESYPSLEADDENCIFYIKGVRVLLIALMGIFSALLA